MRMKLVYKAVKNTIGIMPRQVKPVSCGEMTHRMMIVRMMSRLERTNIEKFVPSASSTTCTSEFNRETNQIRQRVRWW